MSGSNYIYIRFLTGSNTDIFEVRNLFNEVIVKHGSERRKKSESLFFKSIKNKIKIGCPCCDSEMNF